MTDLDRAMRQARWAHWFAIVANWIALIGNAWLAVADGKWLSLAAVGVSAFVIQLLWSTRVRLLRNQESHDAAVKQMTEASELMELMVRNGGAVRLERDA